MSVAAVLDGKIYTNLPFILKKGSDSQKYYLYAICSGKVIFQKEYSQEFQRNSDFDKIEECLNGLVNFDSIQDSKPGSSGGGTASDYLNLLHKPSINGKTLLNDKTQEELLNTATDGEIDNIFI